MTDRQPTLRPGDIVVALQLALEATASFAELSAATWLSAGECHNAVRRLSISGLLSPGTRRPVRELLTRFLLHGVPHAFPALIGPPSIGVLTAHSAPAFAGRVATDERFVWPDAGGTERGLALIPLFPGAPRTAGKNPALYHLLAIVDALRVGHARERKAAEALLQERLTATEPALPEASGS
jgi:hypothetical protein